MDVNRTLIFIDPGVEHGEPYLRAPWINPFAIDLINVLKRSKSFRNCLFGIAYGETLESYCSELQADNLVKFKFTESELYPDDDSNWLNISSLFHQGRIDGTIIENYLQIMKTKLSEFNPDIIITFSPVPFLKEIFPNTLILHHEVGFTSKAPYPHTWYFDPGGMVFHSASFFNQHVEKIQTITLTHMQKHLLNDYKEKCRQSIQQASPFDHILKPILNKFEWLALLPLMRLDTYAANAKYKGRFQNQYDFVNYVLDQIEEKIGVIVIPRPGADQELSPGAVDYLQRKYKHFIYNNEFLKFDAPSQYALPYTDVLIGGYTSLCLQTLLYDVSLVSIGEYQFLPDGYGINSINTIDFDHRRNKDAVLYWMISRYFITTRYLHDPHWLGDFLERSLIRIRSGDVDLSFYDPIDNDADLFRSLEKQFDVSAPHAYKRNIWYQFFDDPDLVDIVPELTDQLQKKSISGNLLRQVLQLIENGRSVDALTIFIDALDVKIPCEIAIDAFPKLLFVVNNNVITDLTVDKLLDCFEKLYCSDVDHSHNAWLSTAQNIHNLAIHLVRNRRWELASTCLIYLETKKMSIKGGAYALAVAFYNQGLHKEAKVAAEKELDQRPDHNRARILIEIIDGRGDDSVGVFDYAPE